MGFISGGQGLFHRGQARWLWPTRMMRRNTAFACKEPQQEPTPTVAPYLSFIDGLRPKRTCKVLGSKKLSSKTEYSSTVDLSHCFSGILKRILFIAGS